MVGFHNKVTEGESKAVMTVTCWSLQKREHQKPAAKPLVILWQLCDCCHADQNDRHVHGMPAQVATVLALHLQIIACENEQLIQLEGTMLQAHAIKPELSTAGNI